MTTLQSCIAHTESSQIWSNLQYSDKQISDWDWEAMSMFLRTVVESLTPTITYLSWKIIFKTELPSIWGNIKWSQSTQTFSAEIAPICFVGPFHIISIQNPQCNFVALTLISFMPRFIKVSLNPTEKKRFKYKSCRPSIWPMNDDSWPSQPIRSADLQSQHS